MASPKFWKGRSKNKKYHSGGGMFVPASGIGIISSIGQIGAFCAPIMLGWIKTLTGSLTIGLMIISGLVISGGLAVLLGVPSKNRSDKQ